MKEEITIGFHYSDENGHAPEIEYAARCLFMHPMGKGRPVRLLFNPTGQHVDLTIEYATRPRMNAALTIPRQSVIFSASGNRNAPYRLPTALFANAFNHGSGRIYSVEPEQRLSGPLFNRASLAFDAIEATFFHLSRVEEFLADPADLDHHGRMKSQAQFLVQHRLQRVPVVDRLRVAVLQFLGLLETQPKTSYMMSHDIDALRRFPSVGKTLRGIARTSLKEKSPAKLLRLTRQILGRLAGGKDPYDTFDWVFRAATPERRIVFFMSGGKTRYEGFYAIDEPKALAAIEYARTAGYAIGLHPSYVTSREPDQFFAEREALERVTGQQITESRQHILRYSIAGGPQDLHRCAIKVDHTLGYQDLIGFRCGTGFRYTLFDLSARRETEIQEQPLVVMDGPLLMEAGYDIAKAREILRGFLVDNAVCTEISFNFHNSIFADLGPSNGTVKDLYLWLNHMIADACAKHPFDKAETT